MAMCEYISKNRTCTAADQLECGLTEPQMARCPIGSETRRSGYLEQVVVFSGPSRDIPKMELNTGKILLKYS